MPDCAGSSSGIACVWACPMLLEQSVSGKDSGQRVAIIQSYSVWRRVSLVLEHAPLTALDSVCLDLDQGHILIQGTFSDAWMSATPGQETLHTCPRQDSLSSGTACQTGCLPQLSCCCSIFRATRALWGRSMLIAGRMFPVVATNVTCLWGDPALHFLASSSSPKR